MLPRVYRLRRKSDLLRVQRSRVVFRSPRLTLRVVLRGDAHPSRCAIAVGRHVSPRANERNTVTRRVREALRGLLPNLMIGADLRFSATAPFSEYDLRCCEQDVRRLLALAGLLTPRLTLRNRGPRGDMLP